MDDSCLFIKGGRVEILDRRRAALALVGIAAALGASKRAQAQVSSSFDTPQLQFALNLQYIVTNFLQVSIYGAGRQLPADLIRSGTSGGELGVSMTSASQVAFDRPNRSVQARVREIGDESWFRTILLRGLLRADAPAQKLIDMSPAAWTAMFRLAGAIGAAETFSPYTSPLNCVLAANCLIDVQVGALAALVPSMTNQIARETITALAASVASNAATIRSILYTQAQAQPEVLVMVDRLAAWRDRMDGTTVTDRALSPAGSPAMTRIALTDADGLQIARAPEQALNVLFMTSAAVTQGGFLPTGINGSIVRSAAN